LRVSSVRRLDDTHEEDNHDGSEADVGKEASKKERYRGSSQNEVVIEKQPMYRMHRLKRDRAESVRDKTSNSLSKFGERRSNVSRVFKRMKTMRPYPRKRSSHAKFQVEGAQDTRRRESSED
jgi:hypothetical protein